MHTIYHEFHVRTPHGIIRRIKGEPTQRAVRKRVAGGWSYNVEGARIEAERQANIWNRSGQHFSGSVYVDEHQIGG